MGLRPVLGRLLGPADDGPEAAGAAVLTHRFWTTTLQERSVGDRQDGEARRPFGHHRRRPRAVGAVSGGNRDHRQRRDEPASSGRDDGRRPGASDDRAVRPAGARRGPRGRARRAARRSRRDPRGASRGVPGEGRLPDRRRAAARSDHVAGANRPAGAAGGVGARLRDRVLERGEPDPGALGAARGRAGDPRRARRERRRAAPHAARGEPAALRRRRDPRRRSSRGRWWRCWPATPRASRCGRSISRSTPACCGSASAWRSPPPCCWRSCRACRPRTRRTGFGLSSGSVRITSGTNRRLRAVRGHADRGVVRAARGRRACC